MSKKDFTRSLVLLQDPRNAAFDWYTVCDASSAAGMREMGYVPVSLPVEVTFEPVPREQFVRDGVALLNEKIGAVYAKAEQLANELKAQRDALLVLTYEQPAAAPFAPDKSASDMPATHGDDVQGVDLRSREDDDNDRG